MPDAARAAVKTPSRLIHAKASPWVAGAFLLSTRPRPAVCACSQQRAGVSRARAAALSAAMNTSGYSGIDSSYVTRRSFRQMVLLSHWYFAIVEKNPDFTVDGCLLGAFENRD